MRLTHFAPSIYYVGAAYSYDNTRRGAFSSLSLSFCFFSFDFQSLVLLHIVCTTTIARLSFSCTLHLAPFFFFFVVLIYILHVPLYMKVFLSKYFFRCFLPFLLALAVRVIHQCTPIYFSCTALRLSPDFYFFFH